MNRRIDAADGLIGRLLGRPERPEELIGVRRPGDPLLLAGGEDPAEKAAVAALPGILRIP